MTGADIAAAVFFMEKRRGKIEEVDLISLLQIFINLSALHFFHWNWHRALHLFMVNSHELEHMIELFGDAEGQCDALRRGEVTEQGAESGCMVFYLVENQGGRIGRVLAV